MTKKKLLKFYKYCNSVQCPLYFMEKKLIDEQYYFTPRQFQYIYIYYKRNMKFDH